MQRESLNTRQGSKAGKIRVRTGREKMRPPPLSANEKVSAQIPAMLKDDESVAAVVIHAGVNDTKLL